MSTAYLIEKDALVSEVTGRRVPLQPNFAAYLRALLNHDELSEQFITMLAHALLRGAGRARDLDINARTAILACAAMVQPTDGEAPDVVITLTVGTRPSQASIDALRDLRESLEPRWIPTADALALSDQVFESELEVLKRLADD